MNALKKRAEENSGLLGSSNANKVTVLNSTEQSLISAGAESITVSSKLPVTMNEDYSNVNLEYKSENDMIL